MSRVNRTTASASFSVSFTVGLYGIAFGAAGIAAGFSLLQTCLLSLLTFSGSLLGIRNSLYGLRLSPILKLRGWKKVVGAQVTIDESTGVALGQSDLGEESMRHGFWLTGLGVYLFWNLFTLAGALGAQAMGNPAAWGLDAAVPAAFLGLVWPRLLGNFERALAASAMFLALALTPFVAAGLPIIATALLAVAFGWKARK